MDIETDIRPDDIVDTAAHPAVQSFIAFWKSKTDNGRLPKRVDLDVFDLKPWMGSIIIMDVIDEGRDFRYRLVGSDLVVANGRDLTGRLVSDCDYATEGGADNVIASFKAPVVRRSPVVRRGPVVWNNNRFWQTYESVHCPLVGDDETVVMTIGVQTYS